MTIHECKSDIESSKRDINARLDELSNLKDIVESSQSTESTAAILTAINDRIQVLKSKLDKYL